MTGWISGEMFTLHGLIRDQIKLKTTGDIDVELVQTGNITSRVTTVEPILVTTSVGLGLVS